MSVMYAKNEHFTYDVTSKLKTKFLGNSVDVYPVGRWQIYYLCLVDFLCHIVLFFLLLILFVFFKVPSLIAAFTYGTLSERVFMSSLLSQ